MSSEAVSPLQQPPQLNRLRRDCGRVSKVVAALCIGLGGLLLLDRLGPWLVSPPTVSRAVAGFVDLTAPAAFLAGLWWMGQALRRFADRGRLVTATADGLRGVGIALLCGGVFQTVLAPGLKTVLGSGPGYYIGLDAAAIVIAGVGAGLMAISRMLRRAAAMEAELDTFL
jgi:hypothetical protein